MLTLREARLSDWARLFVWKNDPVAREMSTGRDVVDLQSHMEWVQNTLRLSKDRTVYIAEDKERSRPGVGSGRLDFREQKVGTVATISFMLDARYRGTGYAAHLVERLLTEARRRAVRAEAQVREENGPSLRAFAAAGFLPVTYKTPFVVLSLDLDPGVDRAS